MSLYLLNDSGLYWLRLSCRCIDQISEIRGFLRVISFLAAVASAILGGGHCLTFALLRIASEMEEILSSSFFVDKLATVRSFMASFSSFFFSASASLSFSSRDLLNVFTKITKVCVTASQEF